MSSALLRPPAVPLITIDPYLSVWSMADRLTDAPTKHWTSAVQPLVGAVRIDGTARRVIGRNGPAAMPQLDVVVHPTRTVYRFEELGVRLTLSFITPALPDDLVRLSWPVTYLEFGVESVDGDDHEVELFFQLPAQLSVDSGTQSVVAVRPAVEGLTVAGFGNADQRVLNRSGDDLRIDWGWAYLAYADGQFDRSVVVHGGAALDAFVAGEPLPASDSLEFPAPAGRKAPAAACTAALTVRPDQPADRHLIVAYDDQFSIEYHHRKLRPYWRSQGLTAEQLLRQAAAEFVSIKERCVAFDAEVEADLTAVGGSEYAAVASLAYRQCLAAHKLVQDHDGTLLYFSKENYSNGCIGTVDVTYPSAPMFLLFRPELLIAQLRPILDYAASPRWRFPYAPHDLGTYPLANGQVYGGGEETEDHQMPLEECGNMLILIGALGSLTGDWSLAERNPELLRTWADYLVEHGASPAEQLCTDDFAGPFADNVNLSAKAIVGIRCYADISAALGDPAAAADYRATSESMIKQWYADADLGDHTALAFGAQDTWSQKYNLVWDRLLGLDLVPSSVIERELAYYRTKLNPYGLPLDNRETYTKFDWSLWTAALTDDADFRATMINAAYRWLDETPSRIALTDIYHTDDGRVAAAGGPFQARSVVGGAFIELLADPARREKWNGRGAATAGGATGRG
ncbi:glutaminase domain-containing protein [Microlunatus sp. GCM10028923]|uniref:glutaminase domain-containing protein n=1 Tax=Microlunatus sp. GCM10028923 TaxID=3273400 RepID=UPI00361FA765